MKLADITTEDITTLVGQLTIEEKDQLVGQWYAPDSFFNPVQDINDVWIISQEEMNNCINPEFQWVKELPLIEYIPKPTPSPF